MPRFSSALVVGLALLCADGALACFTDIYLTRVLGWDATSRAFVVERKHTYACAGCTCGRRDNELRVVDAKRKRVTAVPIAYDDGCVGSFSLIAGDAPDPPEPLEPGEERNPVDTEMRALYATAQRDWPAVKPVVERSLFSSLNENARSSSYAFDIDDSIDVVVSGGGRSLTRVELDKCVDGHVRPSDAAVAEECWSTSAAGKAARTISFERRAGKAITTLSSFQWTPKCAERGCDQLRFFWAPDGSAVAVVAGSVMAEMEAVPDHGPHAQPADVFVVDFTAKPATVQRDELRVQPLNSAR